MILLKIYSIILYFLYFKKINVELISKFWTELIVIVKCSNPQCESEILNYDPSPIINIDITSNIQVNLK